MTFDLNLQSSLSRIIFGIAGAVIALLLLAVTIGSFVRGTFADRRLPVTREMIESAVEYFPESSRILARLAEYEAQGGAEDLAKAEIHIKDAIRHSPRNFRHRLLLGDISDTQNNAAQAGSAYREALRLAPNFSDAHWRMANFLLRTGDRAEAYEHYKAASSLNPKYLETSINLVWTTSGKNTAIVRRVVESNPAAQLRLANLLAAEGSLPEAIEIFSQIDKSFIAKSNQTSGFIDQLIKNGYPRAAFNLWKQIQENNGLVPDQSKNEIWNHGFELPAAVGGRNTLQQFNWQLNNSAFARLSVDKESAHSGGNGLTLEFTGRDTTKLAAEVKQNIVVQPGAKYQLSFFVRTEKLKTTEAAKVSISTEKGELIAASAPITADLGSWSKLTFEFTAPKVATADGVIVVLAVTQKPRLVYEAPTSGTVRLDDFSLERLGN